MNVVVPMQDQIDAMPFQECEQHGRIGQPLDLRIRAQWMMDEEDSERVVAGKPRQNLLEQLGSVLDNRGSGFQS